MLKLKGIFNKLLEVKVVFWLTTGIGIIIGIVGGVTLNFPEYSKTGGVIIILLASIIFILSILGFRRSYK